MFERIEENMNSYNNKTMEWVWKQLVETQPKPSMITTRRIKKAKAVLFNDKHFWWDMLDRHGLRETPLADVQPEIREHAIGNFWGQVCVALTFRVTANKEKR